MSEGQGRTGDPGADTVQVSDVSDIVISSLSAMSGVLVVWYALVLPPAPGGGPGPGLFPSLIGAFLIAIGLILGSIALFRRHRAAGLELSGPEQVMEQEGTNAIYPATSSVEVDRDGNQEGNPRSQWPNVIAVLAAIIFYITLIEPLGFIITMSILQSALMLKFKRGVPSAVVISLISTFAMYLVFDRLLFVPLQSGLLG